MQKFLKPASFKDATDNFNRYFVGKEKLQPIFYIKFGPPASGKSIIMKEVFKKDRIVEENLIDIDIDQIIESDSNYQFNKKRINEISDESEKIKAFQNNYDNFRKSYDVLSDNILNNALLNKMHISWETTGFSIGWTIKEIFRIKECGYKVIIVYPLVPIDVLLERIHKRIGQVNAPDSSVKNTAKLAQKNILDLILFVDKIYIYDNSKSDIKNIRLLYEIERDPFIFANSKKQNKNIEDYKVLCKISNEKNNPNSTLKEFQDFFTKLDSFCQINNKIKVITWNLAWEAMSNQWCEYLTGTKISKCLINAAKQILFNPSFVDFDFFGFQEVRTTITELKNIIGILDESFLERYQFIQGNLDDKTLSSVALMYNKTKYQLDDGISQIHFHGTTISRGILIAFFDNNLAIIVFHADHKGQIFKNEHDIYNFDLYLDGMLNNKLKYIDKNGIEIPSKISIINKNKIKYINQDLTLDEKNEIEQKLKTYNIIMMGDFNHDLTDRYTNSINFLTNIIFEGRKFYNKTEINTCCPVDENHKSLHQVILKKNENTIFEPVDHILTTYNKVTQKVISHIYEVSDHYPVEAIIL